MSEQINEIIKKNKTLFLGREEEIKKFLIKQFKNSFQTNILEDLDRKDVSERLEVAGFRKNLSGWLNIYKNITVSSCMIIKGEKKRFDYKFNFIKEKLDEETIEIIEDALKESNQLKNNFNFKEAVAKIDEMLELIKNEEDRVFNKRLFDIRKQVITAEKEHEKLTINLDELEKEVKVNKEVDNLDSLVEGAQKIVNIAKSLKNGALARKYTKLLDETKKEIQIQKNIKRLEKEYERNYRRKDINNAITICDKLIEISDKNKKLDINTKYQSEYKKILKDVEDTKLLIEKNLEECLKLTMNSEFQEALSKIDSSILLIETTKFDEYDDYFTKLITRRDEIISSQKDFLKLSDNISDLDKRMNDDINKRKFFVALNYCERLIELSSNQTELKKKYLEIKKELTREIEELKEEIEILLKESTTLSENLQFEEAVKDIDFMLGLIGQNLQEHSKRLESKREEIIASENQYRKYEEEIFDLDLIFVDNINKKNFMDALKICEKLYDISKMSKNSKFIDKYERLLVECEHNFDKSKQQIERLIEESLELIKEYRFKEALLKIEEGLDILGDQDLPILKKKLDHNKNKIIDEQESYIKFSGDISELEQKLKDNLKANDLMSAVNTCDLLIQLAESNNDQELIDKYMEKSQIINEEVEDIRSKVNDALVISAKLTSHSEFREALEGIDLTLNIIKDQNFPEFKSKLKENKKEILEAQDKFNSHLDKIDDFSKYLLNHIKEKNYVAAIEICETIVIEAEISRNQDLFKKYKLRLEELYILLADIKKDIDDLIKESMELSENHQYEKALNKVDLGEKLIGKQDLPRYKAKLDDEREEILEARERRKNFLEDIKREQGVKVKEKEEKKKEAIKVEKKTTFQKVSTTKTLTMASSLKSSKTDIDEKEEIVKRKPTRIEKFSTYIYRAPIRRLMKECGAEIVAADALTELITWLQNSAINLTKTTLQLTKHSKRKKITRDGTLLAIKYF